jgi:acyl-CoA thioester hydrolase
VADVPLAAYPVVIELPVQWGEMDSFGHVNNVVYFRYFESARMEYLRRIGWSDPQAQGGIGPILQATSARFRRPLTYPDTIQVGTRVTDVSEDRFILDQQIVSRRLGEVTTLGQGTVVSYDYARLAKAPLPAVIVQRIAELERR